MDALILAGGLGTRLRSVVADVPKPMAPVEGRPFLEHLMRLWGPQGVTRWVLSVGYKHEVVEDHFGDAFEGAPVRYVLEETPLGTGGGLLLAMEALELTDPFLVLNGDTFFLVPLDRFRAFHQEAGASLSMALVEVQDSGRYTGVAVDAGGVVRDLRARGDGRERMTINGGVYLASPEALRDLGFAAGERVSLEDAMFPRLLEEPHRIGGFVHQGPFLDIGIPEAYARAGEVLDAAAAPPTG